MGIDSPATENNEDDDVINELKTSGAVPQNLRDSDVVRRNINAAYLKRGEDCVHQLITHPIEEVQWYATWGIASGFWAADRVLVLRCVNVVAMEAELIDRALEAEKARPYDERRQLDEITAAAATAVRQRFWQEEEIAADAHITVDISGGFGGEAGARILAILGQIPNDPAAVAALVRASQMLVD